VGCVFELLAGVSKRDTTSAKDKVWDEFMCESVLRGVFEHMAALA
jgi:hypothetical protein